MPGSLAQDSEEPCSSRETVYPVVKTAILDEASYTGVRVRYAAVGERLDIISSKTFGPWCWLEVEDGWVIDSASALSSEPLDIATAATSASGRSCYRAEKAFVVGNMNIRSGASTSSSVVAKARAGDEFAVASSQRGETWCWLEINRGWLANTARVRSTRPVHTADAASSVNTQASQQSDINNCCFVDRQCASEQEWVDGYWAYQRNECLGPSQASVSAAQKAPHGIKIEGSSEFVKLMSEALDLLRTRSLTWYNYVVDGIDWLIEDERHYTMAAYSSQRTVRAAPYRRHITVSWDYMLNVVRVASGLVHEACHIHRHEAGYVYGPYTKVAEEVACIENEKAMLSLAYPKYANQHSSVGIQHCEGSLENHPLCRGFEVCEWSADRSRILSCPEIGLTRLSD
jgi:uncharacterized protein YraI